MKHHKAALPVFPFPEHRHMGEVLADEAINRRALAKARQINAAKSRSWRERQRMAA